MSVLVVVLDFVNGQIDTGEKRVDKGPSLRQRGVVLSPIRGDGKLPRAPCRELEVGLSHHCDVTDTSRWDARGQKKG